MIWVGEAPSGVLHLGDVENPPIRLAMSPDGGPSRVVTTPTMSVSPCGRDVGDVERRLVDLAGRRAGRLRDHLAEDALAGDDHEADRVDRRRGTRGQDRALHAPLAAVGQERADVGEAAELRLVDRRLGAGGQRRADLGDDQADVVRRDLDPGVPLDLEDGPELEPEPGHEQVGLVAGFALEGDQLVALHLPTQALGDQADLRRARSSGSSTRRHDQDQDDREDDQDQMPPLTSIRWTSLSCATNTSWSPRRAKPRWR